MNTALAYVKVAKSAPKPISNLDTPNSKPISTLKTTKDMVNSVPISNLHTANSAQKPNLDIANSAPISSLSTENSTPNLSLDTPNSEKFTPKGVTTPTANALSCIKPSKSPSKRQDILYHNDFNAEVFFPTDFNEVDFNIFYTIFYLLKDQKDERVVLDFQQIKDLIYEGRKEKENSTLFYKKIPEFINKLSQLQIRTEDLNHKLICNFFIEALINKDEKKLYLRVNRNFIYILNNLSENYTKFELKKFLSIKGTYTKNIYRLCIQYKNTGKYIQRNWDIFKKQMAIKSTYKEHEINKKVLNPIINFFNENKGFLDNLKYEKIKEKGKGKRGQGGVISGIYFTWDSEGKAK